MNNFILGAGVNGLICAHLLKDYKVLGYPNGSQDVSHFPLGPRFLHFSENLKTLLSELKLDTDTVTVKIGYYYKGKMHNECPENLRIEYFKKTRGDINFFKSSMSAGKNSITAFKTKPHEFYNELLLRHKERVVKEYASKIVLSSKKLTTSKEREFQYENLISTIPAPDFFNITRQFKKVSEFKSSDKYFYLAENFIDLKEYDYVYFPEAKEKIQRVGKYKNKLVIETNKPLIDSRIAIYNFIKLKNAQIISDTKVPNVKNVFFIGRYACWNHSKKINEVIDDVKKII